MLLNDPAAAAAAAAAPIVRPLVADDWRAVRSIYEAGIATGNATFETSAPDWDEWDATHLPAHRLVAVMDHAVAGWAALTAVSDRCVYGGVAENSVYVHPDHQGRGLGRLLLSALIEQAESAGFWTIQNGIFPENVASVALHQACGFRIVGRRERIGQLHGVWRDTLLLEHRKTD